MATRRVRLRSLLEQRHWQNHRTFCAEYEKAALSIDPRLRGTAPSRAQLHRWLSGELQGLPYGDHCRVLEKMFPEWSARQLFESEDRIHIGSQSSQRASCSGSSSLSASPANTPSTESLLASIPNTFSTDVLGGFWVTCFDYDSTCHADICQIIPRTDRRVTIKNYPPEPRIEGRVSSFRNEIEAELVNRHLIGYWKNVNDIYYFGSIHLAVLPGKTVMEGHYTCFLNDIQVVTARWKWVRLDSASLSGADLSEVALQEPRLIHALVDKHSQHDIPLAFTAVTEGCADAADQAGGPRHR